VELITLTEHGCETDASGKYGMKTADPSVVFATPSPANRSTPLGTSSSSTTINLMTYVTMVFQRVFGYPRNKAETLMLEIHHKGRSLVWSGGREQAELYVHQLHSYQLLAHIERTE
jgi:ATP-dependent Clp protease adaptor protein ClpS